MRVLCFCVLVGLVVTTASGCGGHKGKEPPGEARIHHRTAVESRRERTSAEASPGSTKPWERSAKSREAAAPEVLVAAAAPKAKVAMTPRPVPEPQSGQLTAGSFDDNLTPEPFSRFVRQIGQEGASGGLTGKLFGHRVVVTVRGQGGQPVGNVRVRLTGDLGQNAVELITRSDGRAVFLSSWDGVEGDLTVAVTPPDGTGPVTQPVAKGAFACAVTLPQTAAPLPKNLDLVLLLDTTGSMGDELEYLKSEIKSIASAVAAKFPHVNQRFALVVYRDRGDEYLTRTFGFTPSVQTFRGHLAAQHAAGGGDIPEAMEVGLEEAGKLPWRTADTARVLFLVADAPPHAPDVGKAMNAADVLRKKGVAIYPVACSGYDDTTELVMRSCALLTGSQFLFLTNDSGVGEAHGEPHIPFYHVQRLDRLMIRMIADELSGRRGQPTREEILRTVGNPPRMNGQ